jgi:hypothetical protein
VLVGSIFFAFHEFKSLVLRENVSFSGTQTTNSGRTLDMQALNGSGHFVLGLANKSVDLSDNAYIRVAAYLIDETYNLKKELKLKKCTEADLLTMMPKELTVFYPNSLCLDDRPTLVGNWFDSQFSNIFWAIENC